VDAYIDYVGVVEAETPGAAAEMAADEDQDIEWLRDGEQEFDARVFITLDAEGDELFDTEYRQD
jgi:hypothetical protein